MHVRGLRREEHALAGPGARAAVRGDGKAVILNLYQKLGLRAPRLDHHHFGRNTGIPEIDMLGPDAVFDALSLRGTAAGNRPAGPEGLDFTVPESSFEHIHRRRPDELRHEQVR